MGGNRRPGFWEEYFPSSYFQRKAEGEVGHPARHIQNRSNTPTPPRVAVGSTLQNPLPILSRYYRNNLQRGHFFRRLAPHYRTRSNPSDMNILHISCIVNQKNIYGWKPYPGLPRNVDPSAIDRRAERLPQEDCGEEDFGAQEDPHPEPENSTSS